MGVQIIGTGHIFMRSVNEVRSAVYGVKPDIVAVELDEKRFRALKEQNFSTDLPDAGLSVRDVFMAGVREGSLLVFLQAILSVIQAELGRRYGVRPGADMCTAIVSANDVGCSVALIDRDIGITMNRILSMPLREKIRMFTARDSDLEVFVGLLEGNLEGVLEEDNLNRVMDSLKKTLPSLYNGLVDERDRYMALQLDVMQRRDPGAVILAVVGAGHKKGILKYLRKLGSGYEISLRPLIALRKTSVFSVVFLIFAITVAYVVTKIRFRGR